MTAVTHLIVYVPLPYCSILMTFLVMNEDIENTEIKEEVLDEDPLSLPGGLVYSDQ